MVINSGKTVQCTCGGDGVEVSMYYVHKQYSFVASYDERMDNRINWNFFNNQRKREQEEENLGANVDIPKANLVKKAGFQSSRGNNKMFNSVTLTYLTRMRPSLS